MTLPVFLCRHGFHEEAPWKPIGILKENQIHGTLRHFGQPEIQRLDAGICKTKHWPLRCEGRAHGARKIDPQRKYLRLLSFERGGTWEI